MTREEILKEMEKTARYMNDLVQQLLNCSNENEKILKKEGKIPEGKEVEQIVANLMCELGIPKHLKGYKYLMEALYMLIEDAESDIIEVTKGMYLKIAQKYGATSERVEHDIRYVIKITFERSDSEKLNEIFGYGSKKEVKLMEKIMLLSDYIRLQYLQ